MSNCHSKYLKIDTVDSDYTSFLLELINKFSKKHTNMVYPLNYFFSKPYNFYGKKISHLQKNIRNKYISTISTRSCDRDSVKRRVRRRINIIRLKNTIKLNFEF